MIMINHQFQLAGTLDQPDVSGSFLDDLELEGTRNAWMVSPFTQDVLLVDDNADLRYNDDGRVGSVFLP